MKTNQTIRNPSSVINLNSSGIISRASSRKRDISFFIGNLVKQFGFVRSLVLLCFLLIGTGILSAQTITSTYHGISEGVSISIVNAVIQDSYSLLQNQGMEALSPFKLINNQ